MSSPSEFETPSSRRRGFLTTMLMLVGMLAGYGLGLFHFFRYLVPLNRKKKPREMFVGTLSNLPVGSTTPVTTPRGQSISIVRLSDDAEHPAAGFKALSSTCPHLGCKVHWESANNRFFCPCHHGVFDKQGKALEGPPAKENKDLPTYEVKVDAKSSWVYVLIPDEGDYGV